MSKLEKAKKPQIISSVTKYGDEWQNYVMLLFPLIGFVVFTCYPLLWAMSLSFFDYDGVAAHTRFVGMDNLISLFKDKIYWSTWLTTIEFTLYKVPIEMALALFLALLLNKKFRGKGFFRSVFFLPNVISMSLMAVVLFNMFDVNGFINHILKSMKLMDVPISWFESKFTSLTVLVVGSIWHTFGINVLYFIAALNNVPEECYEAAKIDGAGKWQTFSKIQLPLMAPVMQTILLLSINGTLHTGEYVYVMTGGAPAGTTHTVMSYLLSKYTPGLAGAVSNIGYGCASSFVTSILMCLIAIGYNKLSKRMSEMY